MDSITQGDPFSTTQVGFHAKFTKRCSPSYPSSEAHQKTDIKHKYATFTKLLVGFTLGGIVLAKYISSGGTNLPKFTFPGDRRDNFQFITKARFNKADLSHFTMFTHDAQHQKMKQILKVNHERFHRMERYRKYCCQMVFFLSMLSALLLSPILIL